MSVSKFIKPIWNSARPIVLLVGTQSCRDVGEYSVKESFGGSLMQSFPKIFDCSLFSAIYIK